MQILGTTFEQSKHKVPERFRVENSGVRGMGLAWIYLGRNVLCPELSLNMCVIQLADECVCPGLAGVQRNVCVVLAVPLSPFSITAGSKRLWDHIQG